MNRFEIEKELDRKISDTLVCIRNSIKENKYGDYEGSSMPNIAVFKGRHGRGIRSQTLIGYERAGRNFYARKEVIWVSTKELEELYDKKEKVTERNSKQRRKEVLSMKGDNIKRFAIVHTDDGKSYTLSILYRNNGEHVLGCSCPAWIFRRTKDKDGQCKHIKSILLSDGEELPMNWKLEITDKEIYDTIRLLGMLG